MNADFPENLPFSPRSQLSTRASVVLYPHVLTLLNFHAPYNPYEPPPTTTCGKLSMTLKSGQMLL